MANIENPIINQVHIGDTLYDIEAVKFGGKSYSDFLDYVNSVQLIVSSTAEDTPVGISWTKSGVPVTGTLKASDAKSGCIYLVSSQNATGDLYDEYVPVNGVWEKIGNTDVDLSQYAKKNVNTGGPSNNSTGGVSNPGEITTSVNPAYTATGSATISYSKPGTTTGATTGSTDSNTGEVGGHTHSFTGTKATISITASGTADSTGSHSHTINIATTNVISGVTGGTDTVYSSPAATGETGAHTHSVSFNSHEHGTAVTAVTGVAANGTASVVTGVAANGTASVVTSVTGGTTSIYQITGVGSVPTKKTLTATDVAGVSGSILYIGKAIAGSTSTTAGTIQVIDSVGSAASRSAVNVVTSVSKETTTVLTGVKASGTTTVLTGVKASGTASVAGAVSAKTISATAASAGNHTHTIGRSGKTVVVSLSPSTTTVMTGAAVLSAGSHTHSVSVSGSTDYTPAGTLGSAGGHSHSYKAPASHTHAITLTNTSVTGTAAVAIVTHAHTVGVASHTHSLNNHVHAQK